MARCATTPMLQTYILQGYGTIQPQWVQSCLHLFKSQQINLRKVILLKNGNPDCFSMLEIHFLLEQDANRPPANNLDPSEAALPNSPHPFLEQLQQALAKQSWAEQSLRLSAR